MYSYLRDTTLVPEPVTSFSSGVASTCKGGMDDWWPASALPAASPASGGTLIAIAGGAVTPFCADFRRAGISRTGGASAEPAIPIYAVQYRMRRRRQTSAHDAPSPHPPVGWPFCLDGCSERSIMSRLSSGESRILKSVCLTGGVVPASLRWMLCNNATELVRMPLIRDRQGFVILIV